MHPYLIFFRYMLFYWNIQLNWVQSTGIARACRNHNLLYSYRWLLGTTANRFSRVYLPFCVGSPCSANCQMAIFSFKKNRKIKRKCTVLRNFIKNLMEMGLWLCAEWADTAAYPATSGTVLEGRWLARRQIGGHTWVQPFLWYTTCHWEWCAAVERAHTNGLCGGHGVPNKWGRKSKLHRKCVGEVWAFLKYSLRPKISLGRREYMFGKW